MPGDAEIGGENLNCRPVRVAPQRRVRISAASQKEHSQEHCQHSSGCIRTALCASLAASSMTAIQTALRTHLELVAATRLPFQALLQVLF